MRRLSIVMVLALLAACGVKGDPLPVPASAAEDPA